MTRGMGSGSVGSGGIKAAPPSTLLHGVVRILAPLAAALLPLSAVAQSTHETREALIAALAGNACQVGEDEVARVLAPQGFTAEFARRELAQMVLDEVAFLEGGRRLRVHADACPPLDPVPTPRQAMLEAIAGHGCTLDDADAPDVLDRWSEAQILPVVRSLVETGAATIEGGRLTLSDAACRANEN